MPRMRSRPHVLLLVLAAVACRPAAPSGRVVPARVQAAEEFARRAVQGETALDVAAIPQRTVGVTPIRVQAADTALAALGFGLADLLMVDLARSRQIQVVNRLRLDAVLRELELAASGFVDTATAPRVGRLVGARRLVGGSLTQAPGSGLVIDAHVVDVATSQVRPGGTATATLEDIIRAEKELAMEIFASLGVNLTPAERRTLERHPTQNLAAFLAFSRAARFQVEGAFGAAASEYQRALQLDPAFSLARQRLGELTAESVSLERALGATNDRLNASLLPSRPGGAPPGSATDPATVLTQAVTARVIVTTPP